MSSEELAEFEEDLILACKQISRDQLWVLDLEAASGNPSSAFCSFRDLADARALAQERRYGGLILRYTTPYRAEERGAGGSCQGLGEPGGTSPVGVDFRCQLWPPWPQGLEPRGEDPLWPGRWVGAAGWGLRNRVRG